MEKLIENYIDLVTKQGKLEEELDHDASKEMDSEIQKVYDGITSNPEGREEIAKLMDNENAWVRLYSAAASKDLYPDKAKAVFTELARHDELISLKASLNLHTLPQG